MKVFAALAIILFVGLSSSKSYADDLRLIGISEVRFLPSMILIQVTTPVCSGKKYLKIGNITADTKPYDNLRTTLLTAMASGKDIVYMSPAALACDSRGAYFSWTADTSYAIMNAGTTYF